MHTMVYYVPTFMNGKYFPTRYLLLLYTLEIVWGSTNYSYKLPARQKKRHWEQQVLMNALCVDGNTIVLYSM